jgi:hypothetical protein
MTKEESLMYCFHTWRLHAMNNFHGNNIEYTILDRVFNIIYKSEPALREELFIYKLDDFTHEIYELITLLEDPKYSVNKKLLNHKNKRLNELLSYFNKFLDKEITVDKNDSEIMNYILDHSLKKGDYSFASKLLSKLNQDSDLSEKCYKINKLILKAREGLPHEAVSELEHLINEVPFGYQGLENRINNDIAQLKKPCLLTGGFSFIISEPISFLITNISIINYLIHNGAPLAPNGYLMEPLAGIVSLISLAITLLPTLLITHFITKRKHNSKVKKQTSNLELLKKINPMKKTP